MIAETHWWWIRHAPAGSAQGLILGQRDLPIDAMDNGAIQTLAPRLPTNAVWLTSGLLRTAQTAAALGARIDGAARPIPVVQFNEQNFGTWQGRRWEDLDNDEALPFWEDYAANSPPEGESFIQMSERVRAEIRALNKAREGRDIIAVVHAGTIRAALALAMDLEPKSALSLAIDPLSLTRIDGIARLDGVDWRVREVNLTRTPPKC